MEIFVIILVLILAVIANHLQGKESDRWCKTDAYIQLCSDLGVHDNKYFNIKSSYPRLYFKYNDLMFNFSVTGVMGAGLAFSKIIRIGIIVNPSKKEKKNVTLNKFHCNFRTGAIGSEYVFVFTPPSAETIFKDIDNFMKKYEAYVGEPLANVESKSGKR